MLTINSDSTVSIRFLKSGLYKIKGSVTGDCGIQEDSLTVQVSIPTLNLGVDTVLCSGTMQLHAGDQFKQYKWQDGSIDSILTVNSAGTYFVSVTDNCSNTYSDTIIISAGKIYQFASHPSVLICQGNSTQLKAPDDFLSYSWSPNYAINNSSSQTTLVSPAIDTNYIVTMKDAKGCKAYDTFRIKVQPFPVLQLPADTLLCDNATLLLTATQKNNGSKYTWQDASSIDVHLVNKPGTYIVKVETNGCFLSDTSVVHYLQTPTVYLGRDTLKCNEDVVHLNAFFAGATYLWQDNSQISTYDVYKEGFYYCKVSNYCGSISDTLIVKDQICECEPIIPNAFSPNADGINDEFKPYIKCISTFFQIQVFNRGGQVVFVTNDVGKYWDGTFKNKNAPMGTYYYILKIRGVSDAEVKIRSGSVVLLR
jgi:gliding motility-associated-like protein